MSETSLAHAAARPIVNAVREASGRLSPRLNTTLNYLFHFKRLPNFRHPTEFHEKLCAIKLENYIHNPLVTRCADKVRVRDYVEECGLGHMLNTAYGVYENPEDIPWEELPERFVVKFNLGAGSNLICSDKSTLDVEATIVELRSWKMLNRWAAYSEYQYRSDYKRYLVEEYLDIAGRADAPEDYKVYCFYGSPACILCLGGRFKDRAMDGCFMDADWNFLSGADKYPSSFDEGRTLARPAFLEEMLDAAAALASHGDFPFVRVDFYGAGGGTRCVFGEMTFTPAGGIYTSMPSRGLDVAALL